MVRPSALAVLTERMVGRDGIEPPTPGFSERARKRSSTQRCCPSAFLWSDSRSRADLHVNAVVSRT